MQSATVRFPGHPDLICDVVAESIVDEYLRRDPSSRLRVAVSGGHGALFVCGDVLSQADFDVSALVRRTIGSLGIVEEFEPFIALEAVAPERIPGWRLGSLVPVTVTGYATAETDESVSRSVQLARRLVVAFDERRTQDPEWFWLGPDGEVTVMIDGVQSPRIFLTLECGQEDLAKYRELILDAVRNIASTEAFCELRTISSADRRGLAHAVGASGQWNAFYGNLLPATPNFIGREFASPEQGGTLLARSVAVHALHLSGAKAVMLQASYLPGEHAPSRVRIRDERGRDLVSPELRDALDLRRVETWRGGGCSLQEACRRGWVGDGVLPWEQSPVSSAS